MSKFGKLKPALLLQYVIPLLLIFLAFASVSSEKETGRLKLLVFQGASLLKIIFAKALGIWLYGLLLLMVTVGIQILFNTKSTDANSSVRIALLLQVYAFYYYIVTLLATWLSAKMKSNAASLSSMLAVWILWTIFLPKICGHTADKLHPLPSRQEFRTAMEKDRSKGIDGHNPSDQREESLKQEVLVKYKVAKVEDLPINYDGIRMQADEEYGNNVWDKHFGNNYTILQKQKKVYALSGIVNPFASLQNASMGFSGSDMYHHLHFLQRAEDYRRDFIKTLNEKQVFGGSKTGDWSWKENNSFYKSVKDFTYTAPSIQSISSLYITDILLLTLWASAITLIVVLTAKTIK